MATNLVSNFTDTTSSDASQSTFNLLLLVRGVYALVHTLVAKKYSLKRRKGNTMIWRRYDPLPLATAPIPDGQNPAGMSKTITNVSATIQRFGSFIEDSDMVLDTLPDPVTLENVELLGQQMGETFDQIYRDLYDSLTNTVFTNGSSLAEVSLPINQNTLDRACRLLKVNKAVPFSPAIMSGQSYGGETIMPSYWGLCDERAAFDIRHTEGFCKVSDYQGKGAMIAGEIGADKNGIRYLSSPNGFFTTGASGVTAAATDVKNTGGFADVYSIYLFGKECIGGVDLAVNNGRVIRHGLGDSGVFDPIDSRATVGWKKYDARAILNQAFGLEIRTAVSV